MTFTLDRDRVSDLIADVDRHVQNSGCDHSYRFTAAWAKRRAVDWDDLLDALQACGVFCDCEVVLTLPDAPLTFTPTQPPVEAGNPWLLPPGFSVGPEATTTKLIVSRANVGRNTHTKDGEWLVPAPVDAKPRKRVRKLVHFFLGVETGLPSEIGFVTEVAPIPIAKFTQIITTSAVPELKNFNRRVACFVLGKIAKLPEGTPVATDIADRVGITAKHRELNIHRVILRH